MYFHFYFLVDRMFSKSSIFVGYPFGKERKQRYLMMKWILDGWCLGEHQARGVRFALVPSISSFTKGAIGYEVHVDEVETDWKCLYEACMVNEQEVCCIVLY